MRALLAALLAQVLACQSGSAIAQQAGGNTISGKPLALFNGHVFFEASEGVVDLPLNQFDAVGQASIAESLGFPPGSDVQQPTTTTVDGAVVFNNDRTHSFWVEYDDDQKVLGQHGGTILRYEQGGRIWVFEKSDNKLVAADLRLMPETGQSEIASRLEKAGMKELASEVQAEIKSGKERRMARAREQLAKQAPQDPRQNPNYVNLNLPPTNGTSRKMDPLDVATIVMYTAPGVLIAFLAFWIGRAIRDGM